MNDESKWPCFWCGSMSDGWKMGVEAGAAVAFGLMGMAEAISSIGAIRGCSTCGRASMSRVWSGNGRAWQCFTCAGPVKR